MNFLNRLLIIVATLIVLAVATLAAAAPSEMLGVISALASNVKSYSDRLLPAGRLLVALIGLAVDLLLLFWLWLEIRRPNQRTVRVQKTDGARAEVTTETLAERLEYAVDSLADVLKAKARVRSYGRNVEVMIEAEIKPGIAVAIKAAEIAAAVREVAEVTMGLALRGKPKIRIKAIRFPKEAFAEPEEAAPLPALRSGEDAKETALDSEAAPIAKPIQPE